MLPFRSSGCVDSLENEARKADFPLVVIEMLIRFNGFLVFSTQPKAEII
jgi:hypothetical protein